ncbi:MAG: fasciclin domain-containing protein [Acidimicrobiales bacterium]
MRSGRPVSTRRSWTCSADTTPRASKSSRTPSLPTRPCGAPTDAAFEALGDAVSALSDAEIKAILGFHITPPRRTPEGPYPIITPDYLLDGGEVVHKTRTGILTGSDQRVRTRANDGVLTVEDSTIAPTSWCTQTGSVFSIDAVITDASAASLAERVIYTLFFKSPTLTLTGLGVLLAGVVVLLRRRRKTRHRVAVADSSPA